VSSKGGYSSRYATLNAAYASNAGAQARSAARRKGGGKKKEKTRKITRTETLGRRRQESR